MNSENLIAKAFEIKEALRESRKNSKAGMTNKHKTVLGDLHKKLRAWK